MQRRNEVDKKTNFNPFLKTGKCGYDSDTYLKAKFRFCWFQNFWYTVMT